MMDCVVPSCLKRIAASKSASKGVVGEGVDTNLGQYDP